jgi:uncharacterized protein YecT (DUF1311 family)
MESKQRAKEMLQRVKYLLALVIFGVHPRGDHMHGKQYVLLVSIACLIFAPQVLAASFDCTHAKGTVEQSICNDPYLSKLDDQLSQVFAQARARSGRHADALLLDERNWLSERDEAVVFQHGPTDVYKGRIEFLQNLFTNSKASSPLLQAVNDRITTTPSWISSMTNPEIPPGGDGTLFHFAEKQRLDDAKDLPFDIGDMRKEMGEDLDVYHGIAILSAAHVAGITTEAGTSHWVDWSLFSWSSRTIKGMPTPIILQNYISEGGLNGGLAEYQGRAYALQFDASESYNGDLEVQAYNNGEWSPPERLAIRFDVKLLPSTSECYVSDCDALKKQADAIVARYNKNYDLSALIEDLQQEEKSKFELLRTAAERSGEVSGLPGAGRHQISPGFAYSGFGENSTYFPVRWHGELLLGRIANGSMGSHDDLSWILALWRWDGHDFVPALGMVTFRERTNILLSAFVSSRYNAAVRQ